VSVYSRILDLSKNWIFWLILITGVAIIIRSIPAWTHAAWGCDFGIYYGQTLKFVETWEVFNPHEGWGTSYEYFPVLYIVTGFFHKLTGIDLIVLMPRLAPIFGGLIILIFYFVVYELLNNRRIALLSSLFLAVLPFHVYQTSHASPLTMGHFFMMLSILFFLKYRGRIVYIFPLVISTVLLIMSHHLTTYFYLIVLIFVVFFENASSNKWTSSLKRDVFYILLTSALIFSYWAFIATTVYTKMIGGLKLGPVSLGSFGVIALFYLLFFSLFGVIRLIRRFNSFSERNKENIRNPFLKLVCGVNPFGKKKKSSLRRNVKVFCLAMIICYVVMVFFVIFDMPWINFSFTPLSVIYATPLLIVFSFAISGFRYTWRIRNGMFLRGWVFAILISFIYALVSNSRSILPHRHFEYLMAPVSILAILGLRRVFLNLDYQSIVKRVRIRFKKTDVKKVNERVLTRRKWIAYFIVIFLLVSTNALSVYMVHESLGQSDERITMQDIYVLDWVDRNLDKNSSIIISDHRIERMAEAKGFNTSKDETTHIWQVENFTEYVSELYGLGRNYSRVTHVFIDDIMIEKGVHVGYRKKGFETIYMTEQSYLKFSDSKFFERVYRNETIEIDLETYEPVHWAEIYEINWTYLEKIL